MDLVIAILCEENPQHLFTKKPNCITIMQRKLELGPWPEALELYRERGRNDSNDNSSITVWYPYPLAALVKEKHAAIREMMKEHTLEAQRKWRTPYTNIPQIYPSEKDWARVTPIKRTFEFLQEIIQVTSLDVIKGIDDLGDIKIRYFIDKTEHRKLMRKLERRRRDFSDELLFPLPKWGIPQKLIKEGMTWLESQQATALYHIELEAVLKEIFAHSFDTISSRVFTREQHTIWNLVMPFWKKPETVNEPEEELNERSILRDLPPHISMRKKQMTFQIPETTNAQSDYEDSRTFQPLNFTTDFTSQNA